ncbi:MAG: cobyrinate a,c-diamide synthase [Desulfobacteraceae bacterium]|nr:cobyrinate a,c-diamide synthase [Desulfobacteraceae bacterium]
MAFLVHKGYRVAPFKVGPDFIDPGHHTRMANQTSFNLDSWMLPKEYNENLFNEKSRGADIAVVEGVMGLFDGLDGVSEAGSTAQMAKWLNLPVILVIDAKGMARSAAAMVKGFESFDPDLDIAGVVFTRTGSKIHYEYLKSAVEGSCKAKCLGCMPRNDKIKMPERHLGLVTADEHALNTETISEMISMVKENIDTRELINCLTPVERRSIKKSIILPNDPGREKPIIAVARDKAFCFYYQDNLESLEKFGACIVPFSPLKDPKLPENTSGIYLGGGYPELFAEELSLNRSLLNQIKKGSDSGMPIYGECGGFMYLCKTLADSNLLKSFQMTSCFDFSVQMSSNLRSLGYREISLKKDTLLGKKGDILRGHEFHYSSLENTGAEYCIEDVYQVSSRSGQDLSLKGYQTNNTLGSYLHVHLGSNEKSAEVFVKKCIQYQKEKEG